MKIEVRKQRQVRAIQVRTKNIERGLDVSRAGDAFIDEGGLSAGEKAQAGALPPNIREGSIRTKRFPNSGLYPVLWRSE